MRYQILLLVGMLALAMVVPTYALAAGDDCPPPSEEPFVDPGYVENDPPPEGDGSDDGGDGSGGTEETKNEDEGAFASLGDMSGGQLTMAALVVVGVIVGAVYLVMVGRMEEDEIEYEE